MNCHFYDHEAHSYGYWGTDGAALELGIYPEGERDALLSALVSHIHADHCAMSTGIYGNKYLVPALMDAGYADLCFAFLFNRESTSFGTNLDDGATTLWEELDGADSNGSLNHPMHGGFLYTCYTHLAGIRTTAPGFMTFDFAPVESKLVDTLSAAVPTPQGNITVTKENTDTGHLYVLTVPFGARATLRLNRAKTICVNGKPVSNGASLTHGIYRIETT